MQEAILQPMPQNKDRKRTLWKTAHQQTGHTLIPRKIQPTKTEQWKNRES